jgi:hypothetical protein
MNISNSIFSEEQAVRPGHTPCFKRFAASRLLDTI